MMDLNNFLYRNNQIAKLREDLIRARNIADEERVQKRMYEAKLQDLELKLNSICTTALASGKKVWDQFWFSYGF